MRNCEKKVKTQVEKAVGIVCTRSQAGREGGEQNLHREGEPFNCEYNTEQRG